MFRPAPDGIDSWLNLTKAARLLGVTPKTLRLAAEAGPRRSSTTGPTIALRPLGLGYPAGQQLAQRTRQNPKYPTGSHPEAARLIAIDEVLRCRHRRSPERLPEKSARLLKLWARSCRGFHRSTESGAADQQENKK